MTEISSPETQRTSDFDRCFVELVGTLTVAREDALIANQPDKFAINVHPQPIPTSREVMAIERALIEHVITSDKPFDVQASLLKAVGLCNDIPPESEYIESSGLIPGLTLEWARCKETIVSSRAVFLLCGGEKNSGLKVGIHCELTHGQQFDTMLDSHAKPVSPIVFRVSS